jgi:hypothetical protein
MILRAGSVIVNDSQHKGALASPMKIAIVEAVLYWFRTRRLPSHFHPQWRTLGSWITLR